MVPMQNFESWDVSHRLLAVGGTTAQDKAASSCAFGLFDIPTSPRARASARSWTTLHVSSGTVTPSTVGSATGRPEAAASTGALAWTGSRAADARSSSDATVDPRPGPRGRCPLRLCLGLPALRPVPRLRQLLLGPS